MLQVYEFVSSIFEYLRASGERRAARAWCFTVKIRNLPCLTHDMGMTVRLTRGAVAAGRTRTGFQRPVYRVRRALVRP